MPTDYHENTKKALDAYSKIIELAPDSLLASKAEKIEKGLP